LIDRQAVQTTPASKPGSSAKLIKVGIVGLGHCARLLARAASKSDKLKVIAGYSRSDQKRRSFQLETRVPVVSDLKTLLSYPMIDGVIITTPPNQHLPIAAEAAKAKKHIYIESPIAATLEQALEIAALEQTPRNTLTVGCCARFMGGLRKIREAIDRGELGSVGLIEANFSGLHDLRFAQRDGHASSSDPLLLLAIQQFDVLHFLGGEIAEVSAMAAKLSLTGPELHDQFTILLQFADGKLGYVGSSSTSPGVFAVRVLGSRALMHYEADLGAWNTPEKLHEKSTLYMQRGANAYGQRESLPVPESNMFRSELEIFAETCRTGKSSELSATNANLALAITHAALRSLDNRNQSVRLADVLRLAQSRIREGTRSQLAEKI
jgi:predicted dehydrogenase